MIRTESDKNRNQFHFRSGLQSLNNKIKLKTKPEGTSRHTHTWQTTGRPKSKRSSPSRRTRGGHRQRDQASTTRAAELGTKSEYGGKDRFLKDSLDSPSNLSESVKCEKNSSECLVSITFLSIIFLSFFCLYRVQFLVDHFFRSFMCSLNMNVNILQLRTILVFFERPFQAYLNKMKYSILQKKSLVNFAQFIFLKIIT
jgi:hypothetical protein